MIAIAGWENGPQFYSSRRGSRFFRRLANTRPEAYELACLRNPQVRAKMLQTASASAVPAAPPKSNFPNINGNTVAPRSKKMTMDETISSVISKHYSPH